MGDSVRKRDDVLGRIPISERYPELFELARQRPLPLGSGKRCGLCDRPLTPAEWKITEGLCYTCWRRVRFIRTAPYPSNETLVPIPPENLPAQARHIQATARQEREEHKKLEAEIQEARNKIWEVVSAELWPECRPLPGWQDLDDIFSRLFRSSDPKLWNPRKLRALFGKLTQKQMKGLWLYYSCGFSLEEVGAQTGTKKSAVSQLLKRARKKLHEEAKKIDPGLKKWRWEFSHESQKP